MRQDFGVVRIFKKKPEKRENMAAIIIIISDWINVIKELQANPAVEDK
jgi:hypothetical protein